MDDKAILKQAFYDKASKMLKEDNQLNNYVLQEKDDGFIILNPYKNDENLYISCDEEEITLFFLDTHTHLEEKYAIYYIENILKDRILSFDISYKDGTPCVGGIIDLSFDTKKRVYKIFKFDKYTKNCKYLYIKSWSGKLDETKDNRYFKIN